MHAQPPSSSRIGWHRIILVILMVILGAWTGLIAMTTARGKPLCISEFRIASRAAVIEQGAWSYILNERASTRASQGIAGQSYLPTTPIDRDRVREFLRQHPNCCTIHPIAVSESRPSRWLSQSLHPNLAYVEVKARAQKPIQFNDTYKVDACWTNLEE